jgi:hypothetical protein
VNFIREVLFQIHSGYELPGSGSEMINSGSDSGQSKSFGSDGSGSDSGPTALPLGVPASSPRPLPPPNPGKMSLGSSGGASYL